MATKRSKAKYPALKPQYNSRTRQEYIDYDYVNTLSDKDKQYLNDFTEEWLGGNFNHETSNLQKTKKQRKDCYDRNNARNRCIYTIAKARSQVIDPPDNTVFNEDNRLVSFIIHKIMEGELTSEKEQLIKMMINGEISLSKIKYLVENEKDIDKLGEDIQKQFLKPSKKFSGTTKNKNKSRK